MLNGYRTQPGDPAMPDTASLESWIAWYWDIIHRRDARIAALRAEAEAEADADMEAQP